MEEKKNFESYIQGLPSTEDAQTDYTQVISDHLPILARIKVQQEEFRVLSWNVLESDTNNGFAMDGASEYKETDTQKQERYQRIANSIGSFATLHTPDFITLQEIYAIGKNGETALLPFILKKLGEQYQCVFAEERIVDMRGCITLYRINKFEPVINPDYQYSNKDFAIVRVGGNTTKFKLKRNNDFEIRLINTHHVFSENIIWHEQGITAFLNGKDATQPALDITKDTLSIIVGGFRGSSSAPLHDESRNVTTSVSAAFFRQNEKEVQEAYKAGTPVQFAWSADAAFFAFRPSNHISEVQIYQAELQPLNTKTGESYSISELVPLPTENLLPLQKKEITRLRTIISVDDAIKNTQIAENGLTISTYEQILKQKLNSTLRVRRAANLNNEKGIGVSLSESLYHYFLLFNDPKFQLVCKEDFSYRQQFRVIFAMDKDIPQLMKEMQTVIDSPKLVEFAASIQQLNKSEMIDTSTKNAFNALFNAIRKAPFNERAPYPQIIDNFNNLAKRVKLGPMLPNEMDAFKIKLNHSLYGKPPMNQAVRAAIAGVIGAILGSVIGLAIGIGLTFYLGGVGAIPGMLLGAITGFKIATAMALGPLGGGIIGSSAGFFQADKQKKLYAQHKQQIDINLTGDVNQEMTKVLDALSLHF